MSFGVPENRLREVKRMMMFKRTSENWELRKLATKEKQGRPINQWKKEGDKLF